MAIADAARAYRATLAWLAASLVFTAHAWPSWDTVVDDAYISARYAEHAASGHGLVYSADGEPMEGITNLLWTLLLALGRVVGVPMHSLLTGLGWAFGVLALALMIPLARNLLGRDHVALVAAPLALAASPYFAVASTNGIESSMMVAMVLLALASWTGAESTRERWLAAAAASALIWTRPEGIAVVGLLLLIDLWRHRDDLRPVVPMAAGVLGGQLLLTVWRATTYGALLPNTWAAKAEFQLSDTFVRNAPYLKPESTTLYAAAALLLVGIAAPPWSYRKLGATAAGLLLAVVPFTVQLWMPGLRLFLPSFAIALVFGVVAAARLLPSTGAILAGAAVALAVGGHGVAVGERVRSYDWRHSVQPDNGTAMAGRHLAEHLPEGSWMAIRDAGVFAYYVGPGVRVAETHQRALTRPHPGGRHADVLGYTPHNPEAVVLTIRREARDNTEYANDRQVFQRLGEPYVYLGRVYQHYHRYYDVYVRADLDVPPLPSELVVNFKGPRPRQDATPDVAPGARNP